MILRCFVTFHMTDPDVLYGNSNTADVFTD